MTQAKPTRSQLAFLRWLESGSPAAGRPTVQITTIRICRQNGWITGIGHRDSRLTERGRLTLELSS